MIGLITNLKRGEVLSKATSLREDFNFTSLCKFNGQYYGTHTDGSIRRLGGDDDNGVDIDAYVKTHKENFNIKAEKRLRYTYISVITEGNLKVTVGYSSTLSRVYTITAASGEQIIRVPCRRDDYGEWIDVKVENIDGTYFAVREIEVLPIVVSKGRNRRSVTITSA